MNKLLASLICATALVASIPASAQVAGVTPAAISVMEMQQVARGWSVKKSVLGRVVYNESNEKVGTVHDLVIAPDTRVSYLIIGAGGFAGMGRHDVAIPIEQFNAIGGKIVMSGATKDAIRAMPAFEYAFTSFKRDELVANAEWNIGKANDKIEDLEASVAATRGEATVALRRRVVGLRQDLADARDALAEMQQADARRWKEFQKNVADTTARLRRSAMVPTT